MYTPGQTALISITVAGATAPAQVTGLTAAIARGTGNATLNWSVPANGGSAITSYDVDWALASAPTAWLGPINISPAATYGISALTQFESYVFRVRANNAIGNGTWSASTSSLKVGLPFEVESKAAAVATLRTPSVTFTAAPLENDLIVFWPASTSITTIGAVTGWTNVLGGTTVVSSDGHTESCIWHLVTAAEAAVPTFTFSATNHFTTNQVGSVCASVVANVDRVNPIAGVGSTFDSGNTVTPHVLAAVTPTTDNGLAMSSVAKDLGGTAYTGIPAGWTVTSTEITNHSRAALKYDTYTTNGVAVGPANITPSTGDEYTSISVVLKPYIPSAAYPGWGFIRIAA